MKSDDNTANSRNENANTDNSETGANANTIEVGSVGIEGSTDNGASTLRVLKKKREAAKNTGTKRPVL